MIFNLQSWPSKIRFKLYSRVYKTFFYENNLLLPKNITTLYTYSDLMIWLVIVTKLYTFSFKLSKNY